LKHKANIYDKESLELTTQILQLNAEFYTLWNYRRKIFVAWKETKSIDELQAIFDTELKFIEQLIPQNPKSYWLWLHRVWVTSNMAKCDWSRELKLCGKMLSVDERNFHCWDYRRYVANKAQATLQDEYDFTTKKIEDNFSNYSAWHQRSAIIPLLYGLDKIKMKDVLNQEFELITNAFYTEPADQSIWFYHKWLLDEICKITTKEEQEVILQRELKMCEELRKLLEEDPEKNPNKVEPRKWPILTSNFIMMKLPGNETKIHENFKLLEKIDPLRVHYYTSLAACK